MVEVGRALVALPKSMGASARFISRIRNGNIFAAFPRMARQAAVSGNSSNEIRGTLMMKSKSKKKEIEMNIKDKATNEVIGKVITNHSMTFDQAMEAAGFEYIEGDESG